LSYLALLLIIKISITTILVAFPFLIAPMDKLEAATRISAKTTLFFRLYGIAITALLVGYGFGIPTAESGEFPWGVVSMGFVSNAGAGFLLIRFSRRSPSGLWLGVFFVSIAIALAVSMCFPSLALGPAW
jgi:hypothetical protein